MTREYFGIISMAWMFLGAFFFEFYQRKVTKYKDGKTRKLVPYFMLLYWVSALTLLSWVVSMILGPFSWLLNYLMYRFYVRRVDSKLRKSASERYPMGKDQPAQIDCRVTTCLFHRNAKCTNVSPAITLNPSGKFVCWSKEEKDETN